LIVLVECGFVRVWAGGGEWSFTPSFARIAGLGRPDEVVALYAALYGPDAAAEATYVLAGLCDQEDPTPLIGGVLIDASDPAEPEQRVAGLMSDMEKIVIAQHLLQHGMVGKARPEGAAPAEQGAYSQTFDAAEYVAAARVHLGLSTADAEALSMSEFQRMFEMKFPDANKKKRDVPTRAEYEAAMAALKGRA
jgi:hypothetical protein